MKTIELTRDAKTIVDDIDYVYLKEHKWFLGKNGRLRYAQRQIRDRVVLNKRGEKKCIHVSMHRVIMQAPKGVNIDHIDGDGLNNRRGNLRLSTHSQNLWNQRSKKRFKGVFCAGKKWRVCITASGITHHLGSFTQEIAAAKEYDKLAKILHGEFACLNFPENSLSDNYSVLKGLR